MRKLTLVSDWCKAWRWFSIHALAALAVAPTVWLTLPAEWREAVPDEWKAGACFVVGLAGIIGRVVNQDKSAEGADA